MTGFFKKFRPNPISRQTRLRWYLEPNFQPGTWDEHDQTKSGRMFWKRAAITECRRVTNPCHCVLPSHVTHFFDINCEAGKFRIDYNVWTVGCNYPASPINVANYLMPAQVNGRNFSSGDRFDVELLKQCAETIGILRKANQRTRPP